MKNLTAITVAMSLFAATSVSAFEELMSPFDASQAEANLAAGIASSSSLYDFTPSKTGTAFEGQALGLSFVDQNAAFGPEISLIETGNRESASFRLGVGYDVSSSTAPSIDGRRDSAFSSVEQRLGAQSLGSRLSNDDSDPLSLNLGFRLNF